MTSKAFELAQLGDTVTVDSGNVGIGTSSPSNPSGTSLTVFDASVPRVNLKNNTTGDTSSVGGEIRLSGNQMSVVNRQNSDLIFGTNNIEKARLTSSGNLLVGKTAEDNSTVGARLQPDGVGSFCADGSRAIVANRKNSDGDIQLFLKDNTTVGSISCSNSGSYIYFGSSAESVGLGYGGGFVFPTTGGTSGSDNSKDFGSPSYRWDDIYATNGSIQTSDEREKQDIASLTDAEITAAKSISKLFKTYKWKDKVASKGDAARTHTGVIAQQVETAMSDAGLDAGNYAFFISNTWWETSTEVAAVEADEENGIEAQAAYTRTDTYDTADEAPEGATERNRKGIRYPELLSFIGAATEQRLTNIETRLDALEAN